MSQHRHHWTFHEYCRNIIKHQLVELQKYNQTNWYSRITVSCWIFYKGPWFLGYLGGPQDWIWAALYGLHIVVMLKCTPYNIFCDVVLISLHSEPDSTYNKLKTTRTKLGNANKYAWPRGWHPSTSITVTSGWCLHTEWFEASFCFFGKETSILQIGW